MPFAGDVAPFSTAVTVTERQKGLAEVAKGVTDSKKAVTEAQTGLTEPPMAETTLQMAIPEPKKADSPAATGALALILAETPW